MKINHITIAISALIIGSATMGASNNSSLNVEMHTSPVVNSTNHVINIPERSEAYFSLDPLGYIDNNFNIKDYISDSSDGLLYLCTFKSKKGTASLEYDGDGNIKKIRLNFTNITPPSEVRNKTLELYPGYKIEKVEYKASGRSQIKKENYILTLQKDDKIIKHNFKLDLS